MLKSGIMAMMVDWRELLLSGTTLAGNPNKGPLTVLPAFAALPVLSALLSLSTSS